MTAYIYHLIFNLYQKTDRLNGLLKLGNQRNKPSKQIQLVIYYFNIQLIIYLDIMKYS